MTDTVKMPAWLTRAVAMKALRESGETLDQVGAAFGIGGARVRQLLMKLEKYNRRQATAYDVPKEQTKPQPVQLP